MLLDKNFLIGVGLGIAAGEIQIGDGALLRGPGGQEGGGAVEGQPRHAAEEEAAEDQTGDPPAPGVCFLPGSGLGLGRAAEAGSGLLPAGPAPVPGGAVLAGGVRGPGGTGLLAGDGLAVEVHPGGAGVGSSSTLGPRWKR